LGWIVLGSVKATFIRAVALAGLWALGTGALTLLLPYFEKRSWKPAWNGLVYLWVLVDIVAAGWSLNPTVPLDYYGQIDIGAFHQVSNLGSDPEQSRVYIPAEDLQTLKFKRFLRFTNFAPLEDWFNLRKVILPNLNLLEGIASANNFDPMVPGRYPGWISAVEAASPQIRELWLQAAGVGLVEVIDPVRPAGVRFDPVPSQPNFAYFSCALGVEKSDDVIAQFQSAEPGERLLVLEGLQDSGQVCSAQLPGEVRVVSREPDRVLLEINVPADGWVSTTMTNYLGWQASVDDQPTALLQANYLFMAVPVKQGLHKILLQYHSRAFFLGALLSILVLVILAAFKIRAFWYKWDDASVVKHRRFNGDS
jgi:hypothetical protein